MIIHFQSDCWVNEGVHSDPYLLIERGVLAYVVLDEGLYAVVLVVDENVGVHFANPFRLPLELGLLKIYFEGALMRSHEIIIIYITLNRVVIHPQPSDLAFILL